MNFDYLFYFNNRTGKKTVFSLYSFAVVIVMVLYPIQLYNHNEKNYAVQ